VPDLRERLLAERGILLGALGWTPDPGRVQRAGQHIRLYHYTRPDAVQSVLRPDGGLIARRPVVWDLPPSLVGGFVVEGFLEPLPAWLQSSPYFGALGWGLFRQHVGDVLLRIEVPADFPGMYVADYAHMLECKHASQRGRPALGLGYDCSDGRDCTRAYVNSFVPIGAYTGGHLAPVVQIVRQGPGLALPAQYLSLDA
jgi:hypothetical protein